MADFWTLSDGKKAEQTDKFDAGAIDVLPDNTDVLAVIEEAGWKSGFEGAPDVINLRWSVLKPDALKNCKVFQKLKVMEIDPKVSDKAKRMLMAIDTNAGGKLAKLDHEPEDHELMMALMNKPMVLKIKVWKMDGKEGNWVAAVSPAKKSAAAAPESAPSAPAAPAVPPSPVAAGNLDDLDDSSIPF